MAEQNEIDPRNQEARILTVVGDTQANTEAALAAWKHHLEQNLSFPLAAQIAAIQGNGPLQVGDKVTVTGIVDMGEWYGVIVLMRHPYGLSPFPLADLEARDASSPNHQLVEDYKAWFAGQKG